MPALMYQIPLLIAACAWIVLVVYMIHPILFRRRPAACPACGYPTMTAEQICVECGRHRPDALRKWRRRRRVRSACLLLLALAMTGTATGGWYSIDWPKRVPNWVLVRIVPVHPEVDWHDDLLMQELFYRRFSNRSTHGMISDEHRHVYYHRFFNHALREEWLFRFARDVDMGDWLPQYMRDEMDMDIPDGKPFVRVRVAPSVESFVALGHTTMVLVLPNGKELDRIVYLGDPLEYGTPDLRFRYAYPLPQSYLLGDSVQLILQVWTGGGPEHGLLLYERPAEFTIHDE